jgi:hypothetical protein
MSSNRFDRIADIGNAFTDYLSRIRAASQAIQQKVEALGGIGNPLSEVTPGSDIGFYRSYEHGTIYYHLQFGTSWDDWK